MEKKELKEIIERHQHFIQQDIDGWEDMCANLRDANLEYADLSDANLYHANLEGAILKNGLMD